MQEVRLSLKEFEELPEYSHSLPTGTMRDRSPVGKKWKRAICDAHGRPTGEWWMGEYTAPLPAMICCRYHRCIIGYNDDVPCDQIQGYDPRHPELWPEPPNLLIEITWRRIVCLELNILPSEQEPSAPIPVHLL
jgi:hypothetical protein